MADNRAILLTPPGPGAIAVVRLRGPAVASFLQTHFSKSAAAGRTVHGDLVDAGRIIDDAVVVLSPDGSFADLNIHGGAWVIQSVLGLAQRAGFDVDQRSSLPPPAAFEGGTIIEQEMLIHLPLARTELALRALLAQPTAWSDLEQALGALNPTARAARINAILADNSLKNLLSLPRVAIIGIPNVGKSTIANQLFAQNRSITADLPGTTRDWVGEIANLDGLAVMLIDTPGQRDTTDPLERAAITQSTPIIRQASLVLLILDATQPLPAQASLIQQHPHAIIAVNKSDRPPTWDIGHHPLHTVATTGAGIDLLRSAIRRFFHCEKFDPRQPRAWTARQRALLAGLL